MYYGWVNEAGWKISAQMNLDITVSERLYVLNTILCIFYDHWWCCSTVQKSALRYLLTAINLMQMPEMKPYIDVFLSWKDSRFSPAIHVVSIWLTLTATRQPKRNKQHLYSIYIFINNTRKCSRAKTLTQKKVYVVYV